MKERYFVVVNDTKEEIYFASKNQFRAQQLVYQKYDKHVTCKPMLFGEKEKKKYKDIISKRG